LPAEFTLPTKALFREALNGQYISHRIKKAYSVLSVANILCFWAWPFDLANEIAQSYVRKRLMRQWNPNKARLGLVESRLRCLGDAKRIRQDIFKIIQAREAVVNCAESKCNNSSLAIALIAGGAETCGLTKLYAITKREGKGALVTLAAFKRYIGPLDDLNAVRIDVETESLLEDIYSKLQTSYSAEPLGKPLCDLISDSSERYRKRAKAFAALQRYSLLASWVAHIISVIVVVTIVYSLLAFSALALTRWLMNYNHVQ
jgi:hypothetical protein